MVLWHSDLRVSWRAQWVSLSLHGTAILALLIAPWPARFTFVWILLLTLEGFEGVRSQRRIRNREGSVALLEAGQLQWRQKRWQICGRPWMSRQAVLLALRSSTGEKERLWLCRDSMDEAKWRLLRQHLLPEG